MTPKINIKSKKVILKKEIGSEKKFTWSKALTATVIALALFFSILTVIISLYKIDSTAIAALSGTWVGAVVISLKYYYQKAQAENIIKLYSAAKPEILDHIDNIMPGVFEDKSTN